MFVIRRTKRLRIRRRRGARRPKERKKGSYKLYSYTFRKKKLLKTHKSFSDAVFHLKNIKKKNSKAKLYIDS